MEKTFILYQSALPCARINFERQKIMFYDLFLGSYNEEQELTSKEIDMVKNTWRIDLIEIQLRLKKFYQYFNNSKETFTTEDGAIYSRNDSTLYLQRAKKYALDIIVEQDKIIAFIVSAREEIVVLTVEGKEYLTPLQLWEQIPVAQYDYPIKKINNVDIPMRDGIILKADIYLPNNNTKIFSTVLIRTCYNKDNTERTFSKFTRRGFAVVIQDVRGREQSEGSWQKLYHESDDGSDTLDWIVDQIWSNGQIGMTGGSYLGYVQWAAASTGNPHLKAITSFVTAGNPFRDAPRKGGAWMSCTTPWIFAMVPRNFTPENIVRDDWADLLEIRPMQDMYKKVFGECPDFVQELLDHKHYDAFWDKTNWHSRKDFIKVPALVVTGWFDDNGAGSTDALEVIHDYAPENRKVILGPWQHGGNSTRDIHGIFMGYPSIRYDIDIYVLQWFDIHLNGIQQKLPNDAPVEYYTTIENVWKTAQNWPIEKAININYYFSSSGSANTSTGNGILSTIIPTEKNQDTYSYDPKNPAHHLVDMSENEGAVPENYIYEEQRSDVLCYTTEKLSQDCIITGEPIVYLYVSSNVPDTDFIVRMLDVDDQENSIKLAEGVLTAKYRESFEKECFMEEGKVYLLTIQLSKISWMVKKEHRIRVHVTSGQKIYYFLIVTQKKDIIALSLLSLIQVYIMEKAMHHILVSL